LAPIGKQTYGGGSLSAAEAAAEFGCGFCLSSVNSVTVEHVRDAAGSGLNIYQIYVRGDADWLAAEIDRGVAAGFDAICITADTAVISRRERDFLNRATPRDRRRFAGEQEQAALSWSLLEAARKHYSGPLILKGVGTAEDASLAIDCGIDHVYVSNHGGRQIDHAVGSVEALEEVVDVCRGRAGVIVDGGFMRGSDVVKAVALGADLVGLGRLHCLGLAAGGKEGLLRVLALLEDEIEICLSLVGVSSFAELTPSHVRKLAPVTQLDPVASAFPMLSLPPRRY
jgi:glycolate oxidase